MSVLPTTLNYPIVAVADLRSMTAASEQLNLTQGAISQQIARLEAVARGPLFLREPKGLRLTSPGKRLLGKARAMLALNDEVWSEIEGGVVTGRVRLGLSYDLVGTMLAPALKAFSEACPQVDLRLAYESSPDLLNAVREAQLDMVVVEEMIGSETGEVLAVDRLVWVGAHDGRAQDRTPLPISLVAETCAFRSSVVAALARQGRESQTVFDKGGLDATRATVRMEMAVSAWLTATVPPTSTSFREPVFRTCRPSRSRCISRRGPRDP